MVEDTLVRGYHGTSRLAAEQILGEGFRISRMDYDWLGDGAYFFQEGPRRARDWAIRRHANDGVVLVAVIEIVDCVDLLDPEWASTVHAAYDGFLAARLANGAMLPRQTSGARRLDREVINYLVEQILVPGGMRVRSVRSSCREGDPVFPGSALFDLDHIQIAVRDLSVVKSVRLEATDDES